jgi:hypothetical protein
MIAEEGQMTVPGSVLGMLEKVARCAAPKAAALRSDPIFVTADSKGVKKRSLQVQLLKNLEPDRR